MANELKVEERNQLTVSELKELRSKGKVPAVVYGKTIDNASILVEERELISLLKTNPNAILQMELPKQGKQPVMISDIQRDALYRTILHIDFKQVQMDNPIKVAVRIEVTGKAKGVEEGGILQSRLTELEVLSLPQNIPNQISIDVSGLNIGDSLLVSDIKKAGEFEFVTNAEEVIAVVVAPQKPDAAEEDEAADQEVPTVAEDQE